MPTPYKATATLTLKTQRYKQGLAAIKSRMAIKGIRIPHFNTIPTATKVDGERKMRRSSGTVIYLSHDELEQAIRLCYRAEILAVAGGSFVRLPAIIWGDPGIGKTSVARSLAKTIRDKFTNPENKMVAGFWPLSLAYKEAPEIAGFPVPDRETKTMIYFPPVDIPYVTGKDDVAKGTKAYRPYGVLVLDDLDRATTDVRNAAMSLLLDRTLNGNDISPNAYVCGTANGESDAGTTSPLGGACGNRAVHLYLRPEKGWSKFFNDKAIEDVEALLHIEHTNYREIAMCKPRSIEMAMWALKSVRDESRRVIMAVIAGCVGSEASAILIKAGLRSFCLADILNGDDIDASKITFDDMSMLERELDLVEDTAKGTVKAAIKEWGIKIPEEYANIAVAKVFNWQ